MEEFDLTEIDLQRRLDRLEPAVNDVLKRVTQLEQNNAVADVHRLGVEKRLSAIELALNKLVWLLIAVLVSGVGAFILRGGLIIGS